MKRLDTPDKIHGIAVFGIDAKAPGMLVLLFHAPGVRRKGEKL